MGRAPFHDQNPQGWSYYKLLTTSTAFSNWVSLPSRNASRDNSAETAGIMPLFSNILPCQVRYLRTRCCDQSKCDR